MDRRQSLKLLLLAAASSERLLGPRSAAAEEAPEGRSGTLGTASPVTFATFTSRWQDWPDIRWVGPEYWGNRLQDWSIRGGVAVCSTKGPNRTLHCLTHRASRPVFETRVSVDPSAILQGLTPTTLVGLRIGGKGRFDDYRSAAVHSTGVDVGIDGNGALVIGDVRSDERISLSTPIRLRVDVTGGASRPRVELSAHTRDNGPALATVTHDGLSAEDVLGNLALLSHFEDSAGSSSAGSSSAGASSAAQFADWMIGGSGIVADPTAAFGPIMFAQYTLHRATLKLTAQLAPIELIPGIRAELEIQTASGWTVVDAAEIDLPARTARFRVEQWDFSRAVAYQIRLRFPLATVPTVFEYQGTIAAEPTITEPLKTAVFSCNADHGFPDAEVVRHVTAHDPDVALFLGDQFYEGSGGFGIQTDSVEEAALDMLHKWYMFGWSYRELFRHIPAAFIPDDHDVYHGNVWGEGGKVAPTDQGFGAVAQDQGGYKMPAEWVNAVQMAQTSHLPDPWDPTPVEQGIGVYYTRWDYGGVSFAILEDRKFKSAPANVLPPEAQVLNGWIQNPDFDIRAHRSLPEASLLGDRQMAFLEDWASDWSGPSYMKVVLSQTNFAAVHTIPNDAMSGAVLPSLPMPAPGRYVEGDKLAVDMDSNGWPQARRDEALRLLRRCAAFHIAGDQHLATVVRHGIDAFGDSGFTFTGPALNNIWPRRWWPPTSLREAPLEGGPDYAGDYFDGFGNRITVHAAANPRATGLEPSIIRDRVTGYGIVTFDKVGERIAIECWPRHADPFAGAGGQYEGWPVTVGRQDGDGRVPSGYLPTVQVSGIDDPVVEVRGEDGSLVYARRVLGSTFAPPVYEHMTHIVRVGDPERGRWQERSVRERDWGSGSLTFRF